MSDRSTLLSRLREEEQSDVIKRIRQALRKEDTRILEARSKVSVSEAMRLWTTRLGNVDITGQELVGAESLLQRLRLLAKQRKLEQVGLIGPDLTGNIFFDGSTHRFLGAVVVGAR